MEQERSSRRHKLKREVALTAKALVRTVCGLVSKRPRNERASRDLITLAWPVAITMLGDTMMGLVDTKLVGGLGSAQLGGVGVAMMMMYLCYSVIFGLMRGVKVNTAYAVGEGAPEKGEAYAWAGAMMGIAIGAGVWLLGRDISWLFRLLRVSDDLIPYGRDFFSAVTWGAPAIGLLSALVQHRQGLGDSRTPMVVGIAGNVANAVLAYAFIYGKFGITARGVMGAGYATAMVTWTNACVLTLMLGMKGLRADLRSAARAVAKVGVPTGLQFGAEMIAMTAFTALLGGIGKAEMAAHQIAMMVLRSSFLPGAAISEAACVLVGQSLGHRDLERAERVVASALKLAVTFMVLCGIIFAIDGRSIVRAFTSEPDVERVATRLLLLAAVFQLPDAINIVFRGALRGAKDAKVPARISIFAIWIFVPTSALLLGRFLGLGAVGGWLGFIGETVVSATLLFWRWRTGSWRKKYAHTPSADSELVVSAKVA